MLRIARSATLALALTVSAAAAEDQGASARLAMPGAEIARLEPLVGDWAVAMKVTPGPGAEPFPVEGLTASREWILDGRYLRETLRAGDTVMRDATFGFNRLDGRFELVTVDAFEPGQMVYQSRDSAAAMPLSLYGESTEAGQGAEPTGRKRDLRFEIEIADDATNVQRIFATYPGGEEFLFVEQTFTRLK
jgi:hypothetical protein